MSSYEYLLSDGFEGRQFSMGGGEQFVVEPHRESDGERFVSLVWTSRTTWQEFDLALGSVMSLLPATCEAIVTRREQSYGIGLTPDDPLSYDQMRQRLTSAAVNNESVELFRLDSWDHSLVWQSHFPGELDSIDGYSSVGILLAVWDMDYVRYLVDSTGTPSVRSAAAGLINEAHYAELPKRRPVVTKYGLK